MENFTGWLRVSILHVLMLLASTVMSQEDKISPVAELIWTVHPGSTLHIPLESWWREDQGAYLPEMESPACLLTDRNLVPTGHELKYHTQNKGESWQNYNGRVFYLEANQGPWTEMQGTFYRGCLFVWDRSLSEKPELKPTSCLQISIKVVNASLDYRNLEAYTYGTPFSLESSILASSISIPSATRGMLPPYLHYSLDCEGSGENSEPPKLEFNNQSLKQEILNPAIPNRFKGNAQEFLGGYLFDYDLEKQFILMLESQKEQQLIKLIRLKANCSKLLFFQSTTSASDIFILCETPDYMELLQITPRHYLEPGSHQGPSTSKTMVEIDIVMIPGRFRDCWFAKERYLAEYLVCKCPGDQENSDPEDFDMYYMILHLAVNPTFIERSEVFAMDPFEDYYAKTFGVNKSEFSLKLLHSDGQDNIYFSLYNSTASEEPGTLVVMNGNQIITQSPWIRPDPLVTVTLLDGVQLAPSTNPEFCSTQTGVFLLDEQSRSVYFYIYRTWTKILVKELSYIPKNKQMTSECFPDQNKWLLHFCNRNEELSRMEVISILLDSRQFSNVLRFEAVYLDYALGMLDDWVAWYDSNLNQLVWRSNLELGNHTDSRLFSRYNYQNTLNLSLQMYSLNISAPGNFSCVLYGSQVSNYTGGSSVNLSIGVQRPARLKVKPTGKQVPALPVVSEVSRTNLTLNLEEYVTLEGPIFNAYAKLGFRYNPDTDGDVTLIPRHKLKYVVNVELLKANYSLITWVHNRLLFGVRGNEIDVLVREGNSTEFRWNSTLDYMSKLVIHNPEEQEATPRIKFDSLELTFDPELCPKVLFLHGYSAVTRLQKDELLVSKPIKIRLTYVLAFNFETLQMLGGVGYPVASDQDDVGILRALHPKTSDDGKSIVFSLVWFKESDYLGSLNAQIESQIMIFEFVYDPDSSTFKIDPWLSSSGFGVSFGESKFFEKYRDPSGKSRVIIGGISNQAIILREYRLRAGSSIELMFEQQVPLEWFDRAGNSIKCSLDWRRCVVPLDSNHLVEVPLVYSDSKQHWLIDTASPMKKYATTVKGKVAKIDIGRELLILHSETKGSEIFLYNNRNIEHPYTIIQEEYQTELIYSFGQDCDPEEFLKCEKKEVFLHIQNHTSTNIYELAPYALALRNFRTAVLLQNAPNKTVLLFNVANQTEGRVQAGPQISIDLEISGVRQKTSFLGLSAPRWILLVCVCSLLLTTSCLFLNHVHYGLKQAELSLQMQLPPRDTRKIHKSQKSSVYSSPSVIFSQG